MHRRGLGRSVAVPVKPAVELPCSVSVRDRRRHRTFALAMAASLVVAACNDDDPAGNAERFCGEIEVNQAQLTNPELATAADVDLLLELYRDIGRFAPLAIEAEWDQLIVNYETASTIVPGDDASMQRAVATALQSEQAAARVKQWLIDNCALDIGPVATLVAQN